VTGVAKSFGVW